DRGAVRWARGNGDDRRSRHDPLREEPALPAGARRGGRDGRPRGRRPAGVGARGRLRGQRRRGARHGPGDDPRAGHAPPPGDRGDPDLQRRERVRLLVERAAPRLAGRGVRHAGRRALPRRGEALPRGQDGRHGRHRDRRGHRGPDGDGRGAGQRRGPRQALVLHGHLRRHGALLHGAVGGHEGGLRAGRRQEPAQRRPQPPRPVRLRAQRGGRAGQPDHRRPAHAAHVLADLRRRRRGRARVRARGGAPGPAGAADPGLRGGLGQPPRQVGPDRGVRRPRGARGVRAGGPRPRGPGLRRGPRRERSCRAHHLRAARPCGARRRPRAAAVRRHRAGRPPAGEHERRPAEQGPPHRRDGHRPDLRGHLAAARPGRPPPGGGRPRGARAERGRLARRGLRGDVRAHPHRGL
ncbi:MAG: 3-ketoacyl-CoA thiolase, partial [uncultured Solirubrobacteraceae bacterium]